MKSPTAVATVRLIDRRTRVVEVLGPEPLGSRRPSDRTLLLQAASTLPPQRVASCFEASGRRAKFLVDPGIRGDKLLDLLARYPHAPARPIQPYGPRGYLVEDTS